MNKKVFVSMLVLTIVFLAVMYVLKIFFPQEFMMSIQNEKLVAVGSFIDSHKILYYICCAVSAFITYWLYCCTCSKRLYLKWYECLEIIAVIVIVRIISLFDNTFATAIQLSSFIFLLYLTNGKIYIASITYTTHCIAQALSLTIRNLPIYLVGINYITSILMTAACYLWLLLLYLIFNYKTEDR